MKKIKHIDKNGLEFWYARELMAALQYSKWSNFESVIAKAKSACELSNNNIADHFSDVGKTIKIPKGVTKKLMIINYQDMLVKQLQKMSKVFIYLVLLVFIVKLKMQ